MKKLFHRLMIRSIFVIGLPLLVALARADDSPNSGSLLPRDLIGMCGDSITELRLYTMDMADYFLMCQPQPNLSAVQFGWSGERAPGFLLRMKGDALVFKPTVATICYGMNDGAYGVTTPANLETYRQAMTGIVETLKANGVRFIVVGTPGVVDTFYYKRNPNAETYNQTLADFSKIAHDVAEKEGVGFANVHDPMMEAMAKAKAQNGESFAVAGLDGIHPQPDGHIIMAGAFLKALGCDGNIGTITVDLKNDQAEATAGTKVLSCSMGTVKLESTRYPFCFYGDDPKDSLSTKSILPFVSFNQDLNRYLLVVKNSTAKSLKVTWGKTSKTFPAEDLSHGVNLAAEFLDNPFCGPFLAVQQKIAAQQFFETMAMHRLLHTLPDWISFLPASNDLVNQLPPLIIAKWKKMRDESVAAIVPVQHELKIEPAD